MDDGEFHPTYDPSPDMLVIFELGPVISELGVARVFTLACTDEHLLRNLESLVAVQ